jgi:hypothetical protein
MTDNEIPTFTGDELLEEKLKKMNRGLIGDLQSEREKRHSLEQRVTEMEASLASAGQDDGAVNPNEKVNLLAQDPDGYIKRIVREEMEPVEKVIQKNEWDRKFEKAYQWLAKQEKVDIESLYGADVEKDLVRIIKDHGMTTMEPIEGTKAAYKIRQQELLEKENAERNRDGVISGQSTETVRRPGLSAPNVFTAEGIRKIIQNGEYEKYRGEILAAQEQGRIKN